MPQALANKRHERPTVKPDPLAMKRIALQKKSSDQKAGKEVSTGERPCVWAATRNVLVHLCLFLGLMVLLLNTTVAPSSAYGATSRIKDIAAIEGVRDNMLIGYGLVVGLNGTGDSLNNAPFTRQSIEGMLERMGVSVRDQNVNTANVAAVMVTANLPAFSMQGQNLDVSVSAIGDANDLMGGTLLVTPLLGADGEVYAVAQGAISTGAFTATGDADTITQNVPTTGRIANGAIIEREIPFSLNRMANMRLSLRNPDFTTARRVAATINNELGDNAAEAIDPSTVAITPPQEYIGKMFDLMADIEQLHVTPDQPAKIVIDEGNGIIVMGRDVRISDVAVAQGNLTIRITEEPMVSQPEPFAEVGTTEVVPRTDIQVNREDNKMTVVSSGVTIQQLVDSLNILGVTPRDMITLLQAIKAAGAIQADIEVI